MVPDILFATKGTETTKGQIARIFFVAFSAHHNCFGHFLIATKGTETTKGQIARISFVSLLRHFYFCQKGFALPVPFPYFYSVSRSENAH